MLVALSLCGPASAAPVAPRRVMSMNLCTDALVLQLLPPSRIASVTYLARQRGYSQQLGAAKAVGVNHGTAEDVLIQKPDMVIAGTFTTATTRQVIKRMRIPLVEVPPAASFDDIRRVTRQVGDAVGARARADALIAQMDDELAELRRTAPARKVRVAAWDGSGSVPGKGTLFDAILTAAGGINVAASMPNARSGSYDLEQLLAAKPDVIVRGDADADTPSLHTTAAQHPLLRKLYRGREITYPELIYSCGVPQAAGAAALLRRQLQAAAGVSR